MYGKNAYGTEEYSFVNSGENGRDSYYVDLTGLVPEFVSEKLEMQELYVTQGQEMGYLQFALEDTINQCSLDVATWGLARWEKLFDVGTNMLLSYERRRELVSAKLQGQGTVTMEMIRNMAEVFSGSDVEVVEDNANNGFTVRFIGTKGIPQNMQGFIEILEMIKPAHLSYGFEYCYTIWEEINEYVWNDLQEITWNDVRILKEVKK